MNIARKQDCTGCMACVDSCSRSALVPQVDLYGYYEILFDSTKCISCGLCTKTCPVVTKVSNITKKSTPYAVWNNNKELRSKSASGGAFSALALRVLQEGGVVYGACIEGFDVKHKRVDSIENLSSILGSKYQHSLTEGIFKLVRKDLKDGLSVLFCGMACQVAGLKNFLRNTNIDKLYTIDTICGGLSTMLPMLELKNTGKYSSIISFRDKENGWQSKGFRYALKMQKIDGSVENLGLDNLVLNSFSSKLLKRSSCLDCQFTGNNRVSDCTIGDFWGDEKFKNQHKEGLSVIIVHNERIFKLLNKSEIEFKRISFEDFIHNNHNYYWTHYPEIRHFFSRKKALDALREGNTKFASKLLQPNSFAGIFMRIYLKCNFIFRKYSLIKFLKKQRYEQ